MFNPYQISVFCTVAHRLKPRSGPSSGHLSWLQPVCLQGYTFFLNLLNINLFKLMQTLFLWEQFCILARRIILCSSEILDSKFECKVGDHRIITDLGLYGALQYPIVSSSFIGSWSHIGQSGLTLNCFQSGLTLPLFPKETILKSNLFGQNHHWEQL